MNYLDIIIALPLLWGAYKGFTKGLIIEAASLAALLLGIYGAIKFSGITSDFLVEKCNFSSQYLHIISFAITFILIVIAVHFIARLINKLVKAVALGFVNRLFGVIFGILKWAFIISVLLVVINKVDEKVNFISPEQKNESLLYQPLSNFAPLIIPSLEF